MGKSKSKKNSRKNFQKTKQASEKSTTETDSPVGSVEAEVEPKVDLLVVEVESEPIIAVEVTSEAVQRQTLIAEEFGLPKLNLTNVELGKNIFKHGPDADRKGVLWSPYKFAHRMSTGFSSFSLAQSNLDLVGVTDFIGDADCFKKLFKLDCSEETVSLLLHPVGNTILVDDFKLEGILKHYNGDFNLYKDWEFYYFVRKHIPKEQWEDAKYGEKSGSFIHSNMVMHSLALAFTGGMNFKNTMAEEINEKYSKPPSIELSGANTQFLHTRSWKFGKFEFLVGSQVPVFITNLDDCEDVKNTDEDSTTHWLTTLSVHSPNVHGDWLTKSNGMDMWLNNLILDATHSYVCHEDNFVILNMEFVKTEDIPKRACFNQGIQFTKFEKVLDELKSIAVKDGHSYWLYKVPGEQVMEIHDLTEIFEAKSVIVFPEADENGKKRYPEFQIGKPNPMSAAVGTLLYKMCANHAKDYHPKALHAMLTHVTCIYPPMEHPKLAISMLMMYLETRLSYDVDIFKPALKFLNGGEVPLINFSYQWDSPVRKTDFLTF